MKKCLIGLGLGVFIFLSSSSILAEIIVLKSGMRDTFCKKCK